MAENNESQGSLTELIAAEARPGTGGRRPTIMVVAFGGWNDAGEAASDSLRFLARHFEAKKVAELSEDDYYDYQYSRPSVRRNAAGKRTIRWPSTRMFRAQIPGTGVDLLLVRGTEPTYRWQAFTAELLTQAELQNVKAVVLVGALLADVPHTRPLPASITSEDGHLRALLGAERTTYEGPTGILGVLAETSDSAGLPTLSIWAAVPHYVGHSPSPKATLALLTQLEEVLHTSFDLTLLTEEAEAWQRGVNELSEEDPEVAAYVQQLEESQDATKLPEASGESIAREFERYLKRRDGGTDG
ncbi:AC2 (Proteasome assembly chaperone) family [Arthrobacter rhombi]|uniref:AC2 (Proteasome assembly chaperone) family n=1 Tax=Arthrobacter rhombi TaxID=71253 RepID=A0A1R4GWH3_9MICC|nr:AC2 (Proteasome assembly chaperone) family [Arthrobacter rhombi]